MSDVFNVTQNEMDSVKHWLYLLDQYDWLNQLWNDRGLINGNKLRTYCHYKHSLTTETYVKTDLNLNITFCFMDAAHSTRLLHNIP